MKKYKIIGIIALLFSQFFQIDNNLVVNASTSFNYNDEFDVNPVSSSFASKVHDVSGDGNKDHGAIPSSSWGDPVLISDDSYLVYTLGDGSKKLEGLHINITAKIWNQNDETINDENKINFYVSDNENVFSEIAYSLSARENNKFEEEIDLSSYVSTFTKAYLKVELVQSKVNCGNDKCSKGVHKCGTSATIATSDNYINLHYLGVKLYKLAISEKGFVKDIEKPIPNDFKYELPEEIYANKEYTFPSIEFKDNVDTSVDYYLSYQDPYNNTVELEKNAKSFIPDYEGIYTFTIKASDSANNTFIDKFSLTAVIAPNMPIIYFEKLPEKNGRVNENYFVQPVSYPKDCNYKLSTVVIDPNGNEITVKNYLFKPEMVGEYKIYYSATNENGTSKLFARVYIKYNTNNEDPYKIYKDLKHYNGDIALSENNELVVNGNTSCMLPFSLKEGLSIDITLSTLKSSWLGLNFTRYACFSRYYFNEEDYIKNNSAPGLYVLIYKDSDDSYYCNIDYVTLTGGRMVVANHSYAGGNNNNITFSLRQNDNTDTIILAVNGQKNQNYELNNSVLASTISDNEGFIYLGFSNIVSGPVYIKKIDICDTTAPEITINGNINESYKLNSKLKIPSIKAVDAHDGKVEAIINLYSPNGKKMDISLNEIALDEEGIYYLIVSCKDNSNNENNKIFEIKVGNTNKEKYFEKEEPQKGCKGNSNPQAITFLAVLLTLAMGIKKYEK